MGRALLGGALALSLGACATTGPLPWAHDASSQSASDYAQTLKQWSRHSETYVDLEARMWLDATLLSPNFVAAQERQRGQLSGWRPAELQAALSEATQRAEGHTQILLSLVTNQYSWNALDFDHSPFSVHLIRADGQLLAPRRVQRVSEHEVSALRPLFPYIRPASVVYRLTFDALPQPRPISLRVAGSLGQAEVSWALQ